MGNSHGVTKTSDYWKDHRALAMRFLVQTLLPDPKVMVLLLGKGKEKAHIKISSPSPSRLTPIFAFSQQENPKTAFPTPSIKSTFSSFFCYVPFPLFACCISIFTFFHITIEPHLSFLSASHHGRS